MKEVRATDKSCKSHWDIHDSEAKEVNKCWKTEIRPWEDQGQSPKEQLAREVKKKKKVRKIRELMWEQKEECFRSQGRSSKNTWNFLSNVLVECQSLITFS